MIVSSPRSFRDSVKTEDQIFPELWLEYGRIKFTGRLPRS